ncbi:glycosyltransferase family 2 protein [Desulfolithobacter sp.]
MRTAAVIPTRNRKTMINRAIDSVLSQTEPVDEIIVVDDGSTDGTGAMIRKRYPAIIVLRTEGFGAGLARDVGVRASGSDLFFFLDSDDRWQSEHTALLRRKIEQDFQVAFGRTLTVDEIGGNDFLIPDQGSITSGECFSRLARWCFLVPSSVAVTRQAYLAAGGFGNEPLGEDWCFFLRLAALFPFGFCREIITERYLHRESICCLDGTGSKEIPALVRQVQVYAASHCPEDRELADFITTHLHIVSKEHHTWNTVQDWFTSLQRHALL